MRLLKIFVSSAPYLPLVVSQVVSLQLTEPDGKTKLNLSSPITIKWEAPQKSDWGVFDISFHGDFADNGGTFGYMIKENITISDGGEYEWDPVNVTDALASGESHISTGKDFYFEGFQHSLNETGGATVESEKFAVEGYELMGSAGSFVRPQGLAVMAGAVLLVTWLI